MKLGATVSRLIAMFALCTLATWMAMSPAEAQVQPADNVIKAVLYDLDRVGKQLPNLTPQRKANIKRLTRNLDLAEQRLASSSNQAHASWTAAKSRLDAYRTQLQTLMAGGQPPAQVPAQATTPAAGQSQPAATSAAPSAPSQAPQMTSHHQLRFKRLYNDYQNTAEKLKTIDPKTLHSDRERNNWRQRMSRLQQGIVGFEPFYQTEPKVPQLKQFIDDMAAHYEQVETQSLSDLAVLGDIPGQLNTILARYQRDKLPKRLDPPYEDGRVNAWAQYLIDFSARANQDAAWISKIMAATELHNFHLKNALNGTIGHGAKGAVSTAVTDTRKTIYEPLQKLQNGQVQFVANLTPDDKDKVRNTLLGDGNYERLMADIRAGLEAIETGKKLDKALGQPEDPAVGQLAANLKAQGDKINALFETVLGEVRMPSARSDDAKLLAAAAEVLEREPHGYRWERMVINSALRTQKEDRAWWSGGVATIATYDWDQFQVATAEKVGDQYFIFYNTMYYYRSGSSRTPLNRWVVKNRFQSSRILQENIDK